MKKAVVLVNPYLSTESEFYQPRRIAAELRDLGVSVSILPNEWAAHLGREDLCETLSAEYDFCVYLDKDKYTPRILEKRGMRLFNRAEAVEVCDDKSLTHIALSGLVPMPETYFAPLCYKSDAEAESEEKIAEKLGYPLVVKECFGSFGRQVYLARNGEELNALTQRLKLVPHLLQRFIAESAGKDLRVVCVGGEAIACMKRISTGDFRSNAALGGRGEPYPMTDELRLLSKKVADALRLDYCGIDFLLSKDGLLLCEVNSNAYFMTLEKVTGINVAKGYARYIFDEIYR